MNCEKCHSPAPESAAFCRQCGSALPCPVAGGGSSLTAGEASPGAAAKNECDECGAQLRPGAKFCASCGAVRGGAARPEPLPPSAAPAPSRGRPRDAAAATAADAQARGEAERRAGAAATPPLTSTTTATAASTAAAVATSAATTATTAAAAAKKVLIPSFPGRMVWSPRGSWGVSTRMSPSEVADLFESRMTKKANVLMRMNSYFRNVRWDVRRNAISEQIVATCKPTGIVTAGFGRSKIHVDVTGDTVVLQTSRTGEGPTQASVGPGVFTTWLGIYMYPATVYAYDVVKAIKRADRDAVVTYPWSISRIAGLAIILVAVVAGMLGAGSSGNGSSSAGSSDTAIGVGSPPPSPTPPPVPHDPDTTTTDDEDPSEPTSDGTFTTRDGYVVAPPEGWIRDSDSKDKGTFTESRWHLAGQPETYVLVNRTAGYDGEAGDGAQLVRASAQHADDYEELGWRELEPSGWYWEFNINGQHKIDVFSKACGDGYAALGAAPIAEFDTHRDTIVAFIESLAPPCGDTTPSLSGVEPSTDETDEPDTDTTPDATTTPEATPPAPKVSPEAARNSPTRVLRRFWQRLGAGEYDEAHELLTTSYQNGRPSWREEQEAAQPVVNVVDIGPSTISGGVATVEITLYTRDRNLTEGSDTDCHRFDGRAKLVKEGADWRYARDANRFEETVVDSAAPECNP